MDSQVPLWKWLAAAVGVTLACFCLGYFVLGHAVPGATGATADNTAPVAPDGQPTPVMVAANPVASPGSGLIVDERTDDLAAKQKAQDDARKKADAEARKKADAAAAAKAEEDAAAAAAAANGASPAPPADGAGGASGAPATGSDATTAANASPPATTPGGDITPPPADVLYRVRVGTYNSRDSAKTMAAELNGRGYAAMVVTDDSAGATVFHLQVGAYKDRKTAEGIQQELKANGYDASVAN